MEKNKNVGIITWHYYDNVGSNIQAYALSKTIKKMGFNPIFINYQYKRFQDSKVKKFIKQILISFDKILKGIIPIEYTFKALQFQNEYFKTTNLILDEDKKRLMSLNDDINIFVCGSDQIWAPIVFDEVYFLPFVNTTNYKFSYAPSIGVNEIPIEKMDEYRKLLSSFNDISIREEQGKLALEKVDIDAKVVLDPSFLLEKEEWLEISAETIKDKNYVFCYFLGENDKNRQIVKNYCKKHNKKLIIYSLFDEDKNICDKHIKKMGPKEFIGFINGADYIFTDSFHGTTISIILEKTFSCFLRFKKDDSKNQNSRIYNILKLLNIEKRLILDEENPDFSNIDFSEVKENLNKEKEKSIDYIKRNLERATK